MDAFDAGAGNPVVVLAASLRVPELRSRRARDLLAADVRVELDLSQPQLDALPVDPEDERVARIHEALGGRPPRSTHAPHVGLDALSPDPRLARYARDALRRAVRVTAALGADRMVLHSGLPFRRDDATTLAYLARARAWLRTLAAEAIDHGVTLMLENTTERDPACLRPLFEALPEIGFCFDPAHALAFADVREADAWRIVLGPFLRHLHLSGTEVGLDLHRPLAEGVGTSWCDLSAWRPWWPDDGTVVLETVPFVRADAAHVRAAWSGVAGSATRHENRVLARSAVRAMQASERPRRAL